MNDKIKIAIESHIEAIDNDDFVECLKMALDGGVMEEIMDVFYNAKILVPVDQVERALLEYYEGKKVFSPDEKAKMRLKLEYIINRNQIAAYRAFFGE